MSQKIKSYLQLLHPSKNLGGYKSAAIYPSREIVQQTFQTNPIITPPLQFVRTIEPILFLKPTKFDCNLFLSKNRVSQGRINNLEFSLTFDAQGNEDEFLDFFEKTLTGRCCVEITTMNDVVFILNPFFANLEYLEGDIYNVAARFQIKFKKARFVEYKPEKISVIEKVTTRTVNYGISNGNEVTIHLFSFCSFELFRFGYSQSSDISTINFQANEQNNILFNLPDGTYFFFAQNIHVHNIYDCVKATIMQGEIALQQVFYENQIITENETTPDEGNFVAE